MVIDKSLTSITIERMRSEDAEEVAALDKICFATPWSVNAFFNETHNPSAYYIVAKIDGKIVGYAGMWLIMDEAHITTIGVDPDIRGRKVGERMLINLMNEAIHRGVRHITLEVRESNQVAQNLYRKYGFREVAVRKGYYKNNNEDAVVMWIDDLWNNDFLKMFRMRKDSLGQSE